MIGIIGAMKEEVEEIIKYFDDVEHKVISNVEFYITDKYIVCQSGIGKVNSALSTTILFENFDISKIINIGSAGANLGEIGDIVIASNTMFFDVDVTAFGYELGQVPGMPKLFKSDIELLELTKEVIESENINYHIGCIATSDSFINENVDLEAIAFEMEAASISQVCHHYKKPFIVIRSISDIFNGNNEIDFKEYLEKASKNSAKIVFGLLKKMRC